MRPWPFRTVRRNEELDEELRAHLSLAAKDLEERGLSPEEARLRARRDFGNETVIREATRDTWGGSLLEEIAQDIAYGVRGLRRSPGFTLAVLLSLAVGIGANTAIFTLTDATLNRALPFPEADRLLAITEENPAKGIKGEGAAPGNVLDWREARDVFSGLAGFYARSVVVSEDQDAEVVVGAQVTSDFFRVFGLPAALGRTFTLEEYEPGLSDTVNRQAPGVVVISHQLWQRRFGGDPGVLSRTLSLDGATRRIVGVMPPSFVAAGAETELWLPWDIARAYARLPALPRDWRFLQAVGRLRSGIAPETASARMAQVSALLRERHPETNAGWDVRLTPLRERMVGETRATLLALLAAVALVLALASANVAHLQLARGAAREREIAVRLALGVTRARLFRQLFTESVVLSAIGGALGVGLAAFLLRYLILLAPKSIAALGQASVDLRVLGFAVLVTMSVGVASGLLPALRATGVGPATVFRGGSRSTDRGLKAGLRRWLVAGQVAIALVLVSGALLLLQSVRSLRAVDPGFSVENRLVLQVSLNTRRFASGEKRIDYFDRLVKALEALPGVTAVGATTVLPMSEGATDFERPYWREDRGRPPGSPTPVDVRMVLPGYVASMGMRMVAGRGIDEKDGAKSADVVMINESLARATFSGEDPVGKRIVLDYRGGAYPYEIVGVVNDTRYYGLRSEPRPEVFIPYRQNAYPALFLTIRSSGDAHRLIAPVRKALVEVDATQPAQRIITMDAVVEGTLGRERLATWLFGAMAAMALLVSALGIFGIVDYAVSRTTRDIGLRMALGARPRRVVLDVLSQSLSLVAAGLLAGALALWPLARGVRSLLFGVSPHDALTVIASSGLLLIVGLAAAVIPARRAVRVEPAIALRAE